MKASAFLCATCVLTLAGCAHRPPPPLHSARLEIDRSSGSFRPYLRARVAGDALRLLVDTGAYKNILPAAFARAHGLRKGTDAFTHRFIDANGMVTVAPFLPEVPVQFEGETTAGSLDFLMNPSPGMKHGVVTPQALVRPGWAVVMDLEREELRYEPEQAAVNRLSADVALRKVDFHNCLNEGFFNRNHRYVATTINGTPAEMMIDTGADGTALTRNNPAIPSMVQAEGSRGVIHAMASTGQGLLVDDVAVEISGTAFVVPILIVPASDVCSGGVIGMDVLRHCTVVWGWESLWLACHVDGPR